jgi:hypothetical protein
LLYIWCHEYQLPTLDGLQCLEEVGGLQIDGCDSLVDLHGLEGLVWAGQVFIVNNDALESLDGLDALEHIDNRLAIGEFGYGGNQSLVDIDALSSLQTLGGDFQLAWTGVTDLDALSNLTELGGDINIRANVELEDISGLDGLTSIGDGLLSKSNLSLPNCQATGLRDQLQTEGWDGIVCIDNNWQDDCPEQNLECDEF